MYNQFTKQIFFDKDCRIDAKKWRAAKISKIFFLIAEI